MNIVDQFIQPGIVIAFWVILGVIVVGALLTVAYYRFRQRDFSIYHTLPGLGFAGWFTFGFGVIAAGVFALTLIPFQPKYWDWYVVEAHVEKVTNKFTDGSGDITTSYVLNLAGSNVPVVSNDQRASQIEGKDVTLLCNVSWIDFGNSADQWTCSIKEY